MNCFYCKADLENGYTTHLVELNKCVLIIKNVPCMKCTQCGEVVITGTTLKQIEEITAKYESMATEVAIINFDTAA